MALWFPFKVARRPRPLPSHCVSCLSQVAENTEQVSKLQTAYETLRKRVYREGQAPEVPIEQPGGNGGQPVGWQPRAGDPPPA